MTFQHLDDIGDFIIEKHLPKEHIFYMSKEECDREFKFIDEETIEGTSSVKLDVGDENIADKRILLNIMYGNISFTVINPF